MKKLPFFIRLQSIFDPEDIFPIEEQDQVLDHLEYTTEYFPDMEFENEQ